MQNIFSMKDIRLCNDKNLKILYDYFVYNVLMFSKIYFVSYKQLYNKINNYYNMKKIQTIATNIDNPLPVKKNFIKLALDIMKFGMYFQFAEQNNVVFIGHHRLYSLYLYNKINKYNKFNRKISISTLKNIHNRKLLIPNITNHIPNKILRSYYTQHNDIYIANTSIVKKYNEYLSIIKVNKDINYDISYIYCISELIS